MSDQSTGKPDTAALTSAAAVAAHVSIVSVRFTSFSALTSHRAFEKVPERIKPKIGFTEPQIRRVEGSLAFTTTLLCRFAVEDGDPLSPILDIRATAEVVYTHDPAATISDADARSFASLNVPFNAWPYWREFAQSSLLRLGLPAFPLPLFRVADARKMLVRDDPPAVK